MGYDKRMETALQFLAPASPCGYLPEETWRLEYEIVRKLSPAEYAQRLEQGWRRFGRSLFRPRCPTCTKCQPIRVVAQEFRPNRSQRRVRRANERMIRLQIGKPTVTRAKLDLYDRYHARQANVKGWPVHPRKDADSYHDSFVNNPFPIQEWCYYLEEKLVGVGYVDEVPGALSAIYFFYDPDQRNRSLGTWNVLSVIERAAKHGIPHVYLGYYVEGCASMEYKAGFVPNEVRGVDGLWRRFRE
jgi:leucyl-tRNA---protein transferase